MPPHVVMASHHPGCASTKRRGCSQPCVAFFPPPFSPFVVAFAMGSPMATLGSCHTARSGISCCETSLSKIASRAPPGTAGASKSPSPGQQRFHLSQLCTEKTIGPAATMGKQESVRGVPGGINHPAMACPFPAVPSPFWGGAISALSIAGAALQQPAARPCPAGGAGTPRSARPPLASPAGVPGLGRGVSGLGKGVPAQAERGAGGECLHGARSFRQRQKQLFCTTPPPKKNPTKHCRRASCRGCRAFALRGGCAEC